MRQPAAIDHAVLCFIPWGGDESDVTTLSDKMVVARKEASCAICFGPIMPKDRVRAQVQVYDGKVRTFQFCVVCCAAMVRRYFATSAEDEMEIEDRYDLGRLAAENKAL
ncbi:MAG: hypothetical protein NUW22_05090 [Acidobacteria bacterium]|nr:hypothetical protein [Acidobacteriota bacterium]